MKRYNYFKAVFKLALNKSSLSRFSLKRTKNGNGNFQNLKKTVL